MKNKLQWNEWKWLNDTVLKTKKFEEVWLFVFGAGKDIFLKIVKFYKEWNISDIW